MPGAFLLISLAERKIKNFKDRHTKAGKQGNSLCNKGVTDLCLLILKFSSTCKHKNSQAVKVGTSKLVRVKSM